MSKVDWMATAARTGSGSEVGLLASQSAKSERTISRTALAAGCWAEPWASTQRLFIWRQRLGAGQFGRGTGVGHAAERGVMSARMTNKAVSQRRDADLANG
jgi:hypothetical protein